MERAFGTDFFVTLRANGARIAGGNAAVLQKVEGAEANEGVVLLEIGTGQGSDVTDIFAESGFNSVAVETDLSGHERMVVARIEPAS